MPSCRAASMAAAALFVAALVSATSSSVRAANVPDHNQHDAEETTTSTSSSSTKPTAFSVPDDTPHTFADALYQSVNRKENATTDQHPSSSLFHDVHDLEESLDCLPFLHRNLSSMLGGHGGSDAAPSTTPWYLHTHSVGPVDLSCRNPLTSAAALGYCYDVTSAALTALEALLAREEGLSSTTASNKKKQSRRLSYARRERLAQLVKSWQHTARSYFTSEGNERLDELCTIPTHMRNQQQRLDEEELEERRAKCRKARRHAHKSMASALSEWTPFQQSSMMNELCLETEQEQAKWRLGCLGVTGVDQMYSTMAGQRQQDMMSLRCAVTATCGVEKTKTLCGRYLVPLFRRVRFCVEDAQPLMQRCRRKWLGFPELTSPLLHKPENKGRFIRRLQESISAKHSLKGDTSKIVNGEQYDRIHEGAHGFVAKANKPIRGDDPLPRSEGSALAESLQHYNQPPTTNRQTLLDDAIAVQEHILKAAASAGGSSGNTSAILQNTAPPSTEDADDFTE